MLVDPAVVFVPLLALALTAPRRAALAATAATLFAWLHLWWVLPLLDIMKLPGDTLPGVMSWPTSPLVMLLGHVAVIVLVLVAAGVFSPRPGSPRTSWTSTAGTPTTSRGCAPSSSTPRAKGSSSRLRSSTACTPTAGR